MADIPATVSVEIGGIAVKDPFRWLEDDTDPAVVDWQKRADTEAAGALAASHHAAAVTAAVRATFADLHTSTAPVRFGDSWFRIVLPEGLANGVMHVSSHPSAQGRVLVDPRGDGPNATIASRNPSPDGKLLLVAIDVGGSYLFRLLNVADGALVREFDPVIIPPFCAWALDSLGFYFTALGTVLGANGAAELKTEIWWQPLSGAAERQDIELDHPIGWPVVSPDGRWVAAMGNQIAPRPQWFKRMGSDEWVRFLPAATAMYKGAFVGDEFWAISDDASGWCRLVAIPLDSVDDQATWREILPARDESKLASITRCGDHVALSVIEGGVMRLRVLDLQGADLGHIPLPADGAFGPFGLGHILAIMTDIVGPDDDSCTFMHSSLDRSPGVYRADLARRSIEEWDAPAHVLAECEVRHFSVEGPHGPVIYRVMRKLSTPLDGTAAAIVTGYGGFNVPELPHYSPMGAAWVDLGGLWVHAQLRGGGERDAAFWRAGRMHSKQGTFDDFFAVIEDLHARRFTTPARTGIWGTSNGGLLVGATVSQRPELIAAAVAQVPILDMVRFRKDPITARIARSDYGDPDDPIDAAVMHAYSPYHAVRSGVHYPALLCDAGADDMNCPPWHSRKMVAAVEQASASGRRTLLRVRKDTGHNAMTAERFMERDIEELTFFCDELMGQGRRS